jgi:hypothetical protein
MLLGTSLLLGSHCGSKYNGENGSGGRYALPDDNNDAIDDVVHLGHPIWHAPAELTRDSGIMSLGTSLL